MKEFHIQWHITNLCNLRCLHCYQEHFDSYQELDLKDLIKIANNLLKTMEIWDAHLFLSLTGGEPLIKPQLWELLDYLRNQKRIAELNLITNGTLIDLYIEDILKSPIKKVFVSLDGICSETNDYIRGKDVFKKVLDNLWLLRKKEIKTFIMYTLMNLNYNEAKGLTDFCQKLEVNGYILERFFPLGQGRNISSELVLKEDLLDLYKEIFEQTGSEFDLKNLVSTRALRVVLEKKLELYTAECIVARYGLAILADGSVSPCRRFTLKIGNLLTEDLNEIWNGCSVLNEIRQRERLKGSCGRCGIKDCFGCRAMVYTLRGDYLEEDLDCFLQKPKFLERI
ncbi:MAG: radical SAM protein [Candidatus Omnitrophica bacterium]|nr:radical SAM protein [Candidatus Omnitrophota bacterium]